ncbi:MAG: rod shape-determining protein RodA [Deltaproteobacteria bacterium]|nr:rod shape-determining protein RodA [Deltaproteobacteria bacterium]
MLDRRHILHIDLVTTTSAALLVLIGLATLYSATYAREFHIYERHLLWVLIGLGLVVIAVVLDYLLLERFAYLIYGASLALLVAVILGGKEIAGAQRWIALGPFSFQPSEFAKLGLIIMLAGYFSSEKTPQKGLGLKELSIPAIITGAPFLLVAKQPDLGTALILLSIFGSMVLVVGIRPRTFIGIALTGASVLPFAWATLKPYQKERVLSFLDPQKDPLGSGYHLLQSKIAIGSGGVLGKGFTNGTQGKLMFLPEHHTDFIFPTFAEEWGFAGSMFLLMLFFLLVFQTIDTAKNSKDRFGLLVATGIGAMLFWHISINLCMAAGLLPVVGVPLPFISYGGSFLVTCMISAGLIINIRMRRFIF